jgi:hypothetical protein
LAAALISVFVQRIRMIGAGYLSGFGVALLVFTIVAVAL